MSLKDAALRAAVIKLLRKKIAAEVLVLRAAPLEYVRGRTAALVVYVRRHLLPSDTRWDREQVGWRAACVW
jgi:hypothetical protein